MRSVKLDLDDETVDVEIEVLGHSARQPTDSPLTPVTKKASADADEPAGDRVSSQVLSRAIRAVSSRLRAELVTLADPDEMVLEFGASLKGGATVLLSAEGTFKVQLKWVKRPT